MFQFRHINRLVYPQKHILVCEDDLTLQHSILDHFLTTFKPQGIVQFSVVPGALAAAAVISSCKIDVILLDHDMPEGNGADLIAWMKENKKDVPIITFSGIQQNNINMMAMGANYLFNKGDVIVGKADNLIKKLLKLNTGVAETYINKICINTPTSTRYWVTQNIMVGGSILDGQDWQHLKNDYGIDAVINTETEHDDAGKGIDHLLQIRVHDNGGPFPNSYIHQLVSFINMLGKDKTYYIHCQMGGSRSPAFTYAVLRGCYGMTKEQALAEINKSMPNGNYGHHSYHQAYIATVEEGLANNNVAEYYINTISPYNPVMIRYWITPKLLVGGNICNQKDWEHLEKDFGIKAVINVDGHTDTNKTINNLLERYVHDEGAPFPADYIRDVIIFAKKHLDNPIYLHCHAGISRSPHFAYAILRGCYNMTADEALIKIRKMLPDTHYGFNNHTVSYIKSIEDALCNWTVL
jgi:protein-tyrosine phosphatase/CheY-like chemotaxis protein